MEPSPQLRPVPGMTSAPTLTASGGQITLAVPGEEPLVLRPSGRLIIAKYTTTVPVPRRRPTRRKLRRVGWRLLDSDGRCLAWLANSDRPAYADADVLGFAAAAEIEPVDLGAVPYKELLGDPGEPVGPGTSPVTSIVAPASQWMLAGAIAGSVAFAVGPFIGPHRSGGTILLACVIGFVGMFLGILLCQLFGMAQHVWRERRYRRSNLTSGLQSASRTPGLIITADDTRVYVHDYVRTWAGLKCDATFMPYDLSGSNRKHPQGVFVTWAGSPDRVDVITRFDPDEVSAFCAHHGITERPGHEGQLPKKSEVDETSRVWLMEGLGAVPWLGPVLRVAAGAAVVAAVLGFIGVVALPVGICVCLAGFALMVASGYGLGSVQLNDSLVHPDRVG